jgi:ubiquinone/menaquinone biosynthesis C-methylase UbiE
MDHHEMIALIQAGVPGDGGTWADLGAGTGNFTRALGKLLGPHGTIYAVDRVASEHPARSSNDVAGVIHWMTTDFSLSMHLPSLDGILMANALHFILDQAVVLAHVCEYLRPGGRFVLVEYAVERPLAYVPHPVPLRRFMSLAEAVGLVSAAQIGERHSPSTGISMYAALALKPR